MTSTGGPPDVVAAVVAAIEERLAEVTRPPAEDEPATLRARVASLRLEADRAEARLHGRVTTQPVTYGAAAFCAECGEPAPCPTLRSLAGRYDAGA